MKNNIKVINHHKTLGFRNPPLPNPYVAKMKEYIIVPQEIWFNKDKKSLLKLDWNESTFLNLKLHKKIMKLFSEPEYIFWYPDVNCTELTNIIAKHLSLSPQEILVFAGSDEALEAICSTYLKAEDYVGVVNPSYDNFRINVERLGAIMKPVYFKNPFEFNLNAFLKELHNIKSKLKLIYVVNPNNPIGYEIRAKDIESILVQFPDKLIIIDEAYIDFSGNSSYSLIRKYPNLIITRSFSKAFGLAGLRIGYTISDIRNHALLTRIRNGKNITMFAQRAAKFLLESIDYINSHIKMICEARQWFTEAMRKEGAIVFESSANFVLMKVPAPKEVILQLRKQNIYARDRSWIKQLEGTIRITVGYKKQMEIVLNVFRTIDNTYWIFK